MTVIGILIVAGAFEYMDWQGRYRVESQIKQMYADLLKAKQQAMQTNMPYLVVFSSNGYTICEDSNPANNSCDAAERAAPSSTSLSKSGLEYKINWFLAPNPPAANTILLDQRGLISPADPNNSNWSAMAQLTKSDNSSWENGKVDYDCIDISATRIKLGKFDNDGTVCNNMGTCCGR